MYRIPPEAYAQTGAILALALSAFLLARSRPSWRPVALSLALLAAIDVARLWVAPRSALGTAAPWWWRADVALVGLWPVAVGVGLLRGAHAGRVQRERFVWPRIVDGIMHRGTAEPSADEAPSVFADDVRRDGIIREPDTRLEGGKEGEEQRRMNGANDRGWLVHPPILPRLALLACFAIALGALRPALPRALYLIALRVPRWGLAAMWAEAVWREMRGRGERAQKDEEPTPKDEPIVSQSRAIGGSRGDLRHARLRREHGTVADAAQASAPLASALILSGAHVVDLIAGAWLGVPWEAPAWGYARAATWAAYAGVACVMGWAARRG